MKFCKYFLTAVLIILLISGCSQSSSNEGLQKDLDIGKYSAVVQGTHVRHSYSVENNGIFYIGNNNSTLMYYDYNSDQSYILCSSPNCQHDDSSCPANVKDNYRNYTFAYYQGKLYLLKRASYESSRIELISMDIGGLNERCIATLDAGDTSIDSWYTDSIIPVHFSGGKALLSLQCTKKIAVNDAEQTSGLTGWQLLMIDLADGDITELTEMLTYNKDAERLMFSFITDQYAIFEITKREKPFLNDWEYIQKYGEEAFKQDYYDYYKDYMNNTPATGVWRIVDLETEEISDIWSGDLYPAYGEESSSPAMMGPNFYFSYDGKMYYTPAENAHGPDDEELEVRMVDPRTGEDTRMKPFTEPVDESWWIEQNSNGGYIFREGEMLFSNDFYDEDNFKLYLYSFKSDELKEISNAGHHYDIWGMTDDLVILSNQKAPDEDAIQPAWITKEDFEDGNFADRKKISFEW